MKKPPLALTGIEAAIRSLDDVGLRATQAMLARKLGVSRAAVDQWGRNGIPLNRVAKISRVTGVAPEVLRPDYHKAMKKAAQAIGLPAGALRPDFFQPRPTKRANPQRRNGRAAAAA